MKSTCTLSLSFALTLFVCNTYAQVHAIDKKPASDIQNASNIDLVAPAPEPQYVIGDDGHKVYFLTTPVVSVETPPVITDERKQLPLKKEQSIMEPNQY